MIKPGTLFRYMISPEIFRIYVAHLNYIQVNTKIKNNVMHNKNTESDLYFVEKYFTKLS